MAEAFEQQSGQFSRITHRRCILKLIARVVADASFSRVGEHKTHIWIMRQLQELIVFAIDADFAVNRTDQTGIAYGLALLIQTTNDGGIETILRTQRWREGTFDRTNNDYTSVQIGMFVQQIDLPVNKGAQEVSFTKLNNAFRILSTGEIATI